MVPRIFTNSGKARVVWSFTFLVCLTIAVWNVTMIFKNYFSWPINSIFQESYGSSVFPDVTVCNKNPIVYSSAMSPTWEEYINMTSTMKKTFPYNVTAQILNGTGRDHEYFWSLIQTHKGYLSSLPNSEMYSGDAGGSFVTLYNYISWNGVSDTIKKSLAPVWSTDFSVCYTVKPNKSDISNIRSLQMVLYINNLPEILFSLLGNAPSENGLDTTGIRVIVHAPGTKPNSKTGVDIGPGAGTTLHVSHTARTRLQRPYGNCTTQKYLDEQISGDRTATELYSKDACIDVCRQRLVIEKCACVSGSMQFTQRQLDSVKGFVCGNASVASNIDGLKQLMCLYSVSPEDDKCDSGCAEPCEEDQYDFVVSSVPWPHVASQLSFYETYVNPVEESLMQGERFHVYKSLLESNLSTEQLIKELQDLHLLEDNFVNLKVTLNKKYPMVLKETPSTLPETVLSQIGGTLAVWLGMSFDNVVELVALISAVVLATFKVGLQNRKKSLIPDSSSNTRVSSIESTESGDYYSKSDEANENSTSC